SSRAIRRTRQSRGSRPPVRRGAHPLAPCGPGGYRHSRRHTDEEMRTGRDSMERTRSDAPDGAALVVRGRRVPLLVVAAGAGALCAATLAFGLAAAGPNDSLTAVWVHAVVVAVPAAVAIGVLRRRPGDRFAALL